MSTKMGTRSYEAIVEDTYWRFVLKGYEVSLVSLHSTFLREWKVGCRKAGVQRV